MQRLIAHADLFLVFSAFVGILAACVAGAALGFSSARFALGATLAIGALHGALGVLVHRKQAGHGANASGHPAS